MLTIIICITQIQSTTITGIPNPDTMKRSTTGTTLIVAISRSAHFDPYYRSFPRPWSERRVRPPL
jgi:hypothetical protein